MRLPVLPSLLLLGLPSLAHAWPADSAWMALTRGGVRVAEPLGDAQPAALDLLTDPGFAAASWTADATHVYLRWRLTSAPVAGPGLSDDTWAALLDLYDDGVVDGRVVVRGTEGTLSLQAAGGSTEGLSGGGPFTADASLGDVASGAVRVVALFGGTVAVDAAIPRADLSQTLGVDHTTPHAWVMVTGAGDAAAGFVDVLGCDDTVGCSTLVEVRPDRIAIDTDGDGLTDPLEMLGFTDPLDPDTDDDGVLDGADPGPLTCDTDRDGLPDGLELGVASAPPGTDVNAGCFRADAAPGSTTDPLDSDTDDAGLPDGLEDRNRNGRIDAFETDPNLPDDDHDSDGDTIPDVVEGMGDSDGDTIPDRFDDDSDGDGLPDRLDGVWDADLDRVPAFQDPDADGDGLGDGLEGTSDPDGDGRPAHADRDADGDGIRDDIDGIDDFDGDGDPNFLDTDSDGDRRPDAEEKLDDLDCDGRPDFLDPISDDGFCDTDLPRGAIDTGGFDGTIAPITPSPGGTYTGGACGHLPRTAWLWLLAPCWLRRRRITTPSS